MSPEQSLIHALSSAIFPLGFVAAEHPDKAHDFRLSALWVRKTWNTNRAIALMRLPDDPRHAGQISQELKFAVGRMARYFPFFYGLGLQLVWSGHGIGERADDLQAWVDKIDNQRCIIQSIHVIDLSFNRTLSARTWGQVVTGRFQDAIEAALASVIKS